MAGWVFGRKVWIEGIGVFTITDVMAKKLNGKPQEDSVDVFVFNLKKARKIGRKRRIVALLGVI